MSKDQVPGEPPTDCPSGVRPPQGRRAQIVGSWHRRPPGAAGSVQPEENHRA
ncbi:hypothetical protein [Streptomyces sp. 3N207]|uniref:hypothetical protein n=1 Tax=Streptomyces sp. 3N207 TaxID=3457417 RepID=UPI003FD5CEC0